MEEIYALFEQDLVDIEKVIRLLDTLFSFGTESHSEELDKESSFIKKSIELHKSIIEGQAGSVKIPGTLILYLGGRFEDFMRSLFEDLAIQVANNSSNFKSLPSNMREALIRDTSEVIANPRKFNHGEGARDTFIKNLSDNIHLNNLSEINAQCLSITSANMRPDIINELFSKVGLKEVWRKVGEQAKIKTHFGTDASQQAENDCKKYLELI